MIYCFDIDETICTSVGIDYNTAVPFQERLDFINELFEMGHTIKMYTARGSKTGLDLTQFTKDQLDSWGLKYHELVMGKPFADIYVDDKALNSEVFFSENLPINGEN